VDEDCLGNKSSIVSSNRSNLIFFRLVSSNCEWRCSSSVGTSLCIRLRLLFSLRIDMTASVLVSSNIGAFSVLLNELLLEVKLESEFLGEN